MLKVAIIFFSGTGLTKQLVESFDAGLIKNGIQTYIHQIRGTEIVEGRFINKKVFDELESAAAIVFASPTYMGGPAAQFKAFADASSECWFSQRWSGKIAAGITCGGAPNGDQTSTLQYFCTLASQHGMLWAGLDITNGNGVDVNRLGCQLGIVSENTGETVNPIDLTTAQYLGERIAKMVSRFE